MSPDSNEKKEKPPVKVIAKKSFAQKVTTATGYRVSSNYCRKCCQNLNPKLFVPAFDTYLDANGLHSICINCHEDIFQDCLQGERDLSRAFLKYCRIVNLVFRQTAVEGVIRIIEKKPDAKYAGEYRRIIQGMYNLADKIRLGKELTFSEPSKEDFVPREVSEKEVSRETLELFGEGLPKEDYAFLEREFLELKKSYKCELRSEVLIFREICFTLLEIQKARARADSVDGLQKRLSTLLKDGAISPAQQTQSDSGSSKDSYGVWLRDIEQFTPAQFFDEEKVKKYFNYGDFAYFKDYYVRSLTNLVTNSRNFSLSEDSFSDGDFDEVLEENNGKETETKIGRAHV